MENNMITLPNGMKVEEDILSMLPWSRSSVDAGYNGRSWDDTEWWTVLVECGSGENTIVGIGWESRDSEGNWDVGIRPEHGIFIGENAYEEACQAWRFDDYRSDW